MSEHEVPPNINVNESSMDSTNLGTSESFPPRRMRPDTSILNGSNRPPVAISVAIDPIALITTECITVTSAMRKDARWAHSSVSAILGSASSAPAGSGGFRGSRSGASRDGAAERSRRKNGRSSGLPDGVDDGLTNRWGLRGKRGKSIQDNPLMARFGRLRRQLSGCKDIRTFDTPSLLHPFLEVIEASEIAAPITSLALVAITKFHEYNLIGSESPRFAVAMQSLSDAITHCKFEVTNSPTDEIVLLQILRLMEIMMSGPGGDLLSDGSVCQIMETGLSMCCQPNLSELLKRSAEMAMANMCRIVFERLKHLEVEAGDEAEALDEKTKKDMDTVKMDPSVNGNNAVTSSLTEPNSRSSASFEEEPVTDEHWIDKNGSQANLAARSETSDDPGIKPYSLPSIRELLRVLIGLLDPHNKLQADTMRVMALRIINVALEVAGPSIASHPTLALLCEDQLCRHLFQLVRSDNMYILHESLIVTGTLLATCRGVLKLQQELFLSYLVACLHPKVEIPREPGIDPSLYDGVPQAPTLVKPAPSQPGSGRATPVPVKDRQKLGMEGGSRKPYAREAMVESVGALARIPSFMVELFVNYDCEVDRSDLCEDMVGLLSRNAFPDSATWSTTSVPPLCLDALLGYVQFIKDRLDDEPQAEGYPERQKLLDQRQRKKLIIKGASKFNESPKSGLAYLASQGIIKDVNDGTAIASFLRGTSRISKKVLGEYIAKKGSEAVLKAFLDSFDFSGKRIDQALRELLESFRLPGESALIERIVEQFVERYCGQCGGNVDANFTLTYAIIMLNVDQHSPRIKEARMTPMAFAKNLRGVNNNGDFDEQYLQDIYDSIKRDEIILPDEHDNKHAFDYAWKELLIKTESAGNLVICDTNLFDADMFAATWKPVVATLSYVFMSASDDAVFSRVVIGFNQCAEIATKYGLTEAIDQIVYCLSCMSSLATDTPCNTALNTEVQVEGSRVMVSEMAVKFGRDFKAQLATLVLFRVVTGSEVFIQNSWKYIVRIWLNLFINSLISPSFSEASSNLDIGPIPLQHPSQIIDRGSRTGNTGLFQAFTSYIQSYAADDPPEPSDEEMESTMCTVDCINACYVGDVFKNVMAMPTDALKHLVLALLSHLPEDPSLAVIAVKPEIPAAVPANVQSSNSPTYDPAAIYLLELCTTLALRDGETVKELGGDVVEALQNVVRDATSYHPIMISRSIYFLLSLLHASYEHSFLRVPVVLHTISSFQRDTLDKSSILILKGITKCMEDPGPLRNEMMASPDFWAILKSLASNAGSATAVFEILENVTTCSPPAITADNYEPAVQLLNSFASAGGIGSAIESRPTKGTRRGAPPKAAKKQDDAVVKRGVRAVHIIFQLTRRIPELMKQSHLESSQAWQAYWTPIFQALTAQCTNANRETRQQAFASLQRTLLSTEVRAGRAAEWTAVFAEVLFPLIRRLLKPEVYSSDPVGMSETRVQAATLLCRVFLHHIEPLARWPGMLELWLGILDIMDRLMNSGQGDSLEEAVPECLKNILLVMASSGYLVRPGPAPAATPDVPPQAAADAQLRRSLWAATWKRLDRFLPDLKRELGMATDSDADAAGEEEAVGSVAAAEVTATTKEEAAVPLLATPQPQGEDGVRIASDPSSPAAPTTESGGRRLPVMSIASGAGDDVVASSSVVESQAEVRAETEAQAGAQAEAGG